MLNYCYKAMLKVKNLQQISGNILFACKYNVSFLDLYYHFLSFFNYALKRMIKLA